MKTEVKIQIIYCHPSKKSYTYEILEQLRSTLKKSTIDKEKIKSNHSAIIQSISEKIKKYRLPFLLILTTLLACNPTPPVVTNQMSNLLFLAHTRSATQGKIKDNLLKIPYKNYDVLGLCGDLDVLTSLDTTTMKKWDTLFDFGNDHTLWAIGNHDNTNVDLIEKFTKRPSFYKWDYQDFTFLVLDTELDQSDIKGEQLDLVKNTVANLQNEKYLFVLTHRLIWMPGHKDLEPQIDTIANGPAGDCNYCTNPNNFYKTVYPELKKATNKGIQVFCIAGDIGNNSNSFHYKTKEGIHFLATGINNINPRPNKALHFQINHVESTIEWNFKPLEAL